MPESSSDGIAEAKPAEAATDVKAPAESSPAEKPGEKPDKGEKGDMLSAVKAALAPKEESPPSENADSKPAAEDPDKPKEGEEGDDGADEFTEEELSSLKAKTRRQFEKRNARITELSAEIEQHKPKAEQFDRIVKFVDEANLAPAEVNDLFDIGRNLKLAPRKAYEQIKPVYEKLQRMFGDVLPDDLQAEVNQGRLTVDHARNLAASRTESAVATQNAQRLQQRQQEQQQRQATEAQVNEVKSKVSDWETSKAKSDPDWSLKQADVLQAIELSLLRRAQEGKPLPSSAEAVEIAEKALTGVNTKFAHLAPKRREVKPITDASSVPSTAKPASALEAVKQGMAKLKTG